MEIPVQEMEVEFTIGTIIKTVAKLDEPFVNDCVFPFPHCPNGTGINFEIFEIIMSTLGFNYTVERAEEADTGYIDRHGQWRGMIGQLLRHEVNMTATLTSIAEDRLKVVDFSSPASFYSKGFLIQRPTAADEAADPAFLTTPFSPSVWYCFLASLAVYTVLAFLSRLFLNPPNSGKPFRLFRDSVLDVVRSPLGQTEPRPYSTSLRFTLNYLNVAMFFLMNFYTATLTGTLMFMGKPPDPFTGVRELADLVQSGEYTLVSLGSMNKFLPPLPNETLDIGRPETILRKASAYNPPLMVHTLQEVVKAIERNKSLVFWSSLNQVMEAAAQSCDLYVIEDKYSMPTWLAFMFRKGDPLQHIVSKTLYRDTSVESFMNRMIKKYAKHRRCEHEPASNEAGSTFFALGLAQMQGAYFVLLYGLAIAAPTFLAEHVARRLGKKRPRKTPVISIPQVSVESDVFEATENAPRVCRKSDSAPVNVEEPEAKPLAIRQCSEISLDKSRSSLVINNYLGVRRISTISLTTSNFAETLEESDL